MSSLTCNPVVSVKGIMVSVDPHHYYGRNRGNSDIAVLYVYVSQNRNQTNTVIVDLNILLLTEAILSSLTCNSCIVLHTKATVVVVVELHTVLDT